MVPYPEWDLNLDRQLTLGSNEHCVVDLNYSATTAGLKQLYIMI